MEREINSTAAPAPSPDDVPMAFAKTLLVQARNFGQDVEDIVRASGFPFNPLEEQPAVAVSVEQYSRLCMALFQRLGDEAGGIIQGVRTPLGATRMLAYSMIRCRDLQHALERAIEFNAACRERPEGILHHSITRRDERLARLAYLSAQGGRDQSGVLCSMAVWLRFCSWLIGRDIEPLAAGCAGREPRNRAGLQHFFPCPVHFGEAVNWIDFPAALLAAPVLRNEAQLESFLRVAPYHAVIKPVAGEQSLSARIRELIGQDFQREPPDFGELTRRLNLSARTLRRRLAAEGTSYQRLKDHARRDAAIAYLRDPELTVSDVAELVGFSDASAFHRSFKRWTGKSPGDYRL
jgi:AraC-like DNA-binding protein